jgi:hypothetical protein
MNLLLLLLFSWLIFFLIFHRYHSGQYYSPEGFQTVPEGKNTNKNNKNDKNPNIASDIITSVNNKNTNDENLDSVEEEEQVEVDNSDKELSGSNTSENVRSQLLSNEIVEREPDVKNCLFVPRGHSVQACIDRCHNREDRQYWGGDNCTNKNCMTICTGCKNKDHCEWITSDSIYEDVAVPNPPPKQEITVLAGNSSAVVIWSSIENKDQSNIAFLVKYFKTYKPFEGVKIANVVIEDSEKKNFKYNIGNLDNNEFYSVGIMAVNETDVGPMSNIVQITPKQNKKIYNN